MYDSSNPDGRMVYLGTYVVGQIFYVTEDDPTCGLKVDDQVVLVGGVNGKARVLHKGKVLDTDFERLL